MPTTRISSPILIGRGDELAVLHSLLDRATGGTGVALLIAGEAGVGKSRLVRELAASARTRDVPVLAGGSVDFGEGSLPFGAVTEALRPLPGLLGPDRLATVVAGRELDLGRVLPELLPRGPSAPETPAGPHAQARLFELLLQLLDAEAEATGLVLVLEDIHWADPSTRELFAFLARNVARSRMLLIGTYRSDELHRTHPLRPYISGLVATRHVELLELDRLEREQIADLVAAIGGGPPDPGVVEQLFARSLGNPFYTEELLGGSVAGARLPSSLRDTLLSRLERLAQPARVAVEALAVLGRPADESLLAAIGGHSESNLEAAIREAAERHVIVRDPDDGRWYFRHALMQEAVYDQLLGTERTRIHRRVAEAIEATAPGRAVTGIDTELARHYGRGREPARALAASARAAREAAARYAYPEALQHWEQVLELWEEVPGAATVVDLDHAGVLAEAAQAAASPWSRSSVTSEGGHRRAVALIRAALAEVDPDRQPIRAALGYAFLMTQYFSAGEVDDAETARRTALELLDRAPPSLDHVRIFNMAAYPPLFASRYAEVADAGSRALAIATQIGATVEGAFARVPLGIALSFLGRVDEGEAHLEAALAAARSTGQPDALADAYTSLGIVREAAGRFDDAIGIMAEGLEALTDWRVERTHAATLRNNMAEALRRVGRWDEAMSMLQRELAHRGTGWEIGHGSVLTGHLLAALGRHDESAAALDRAWQEFGPAGTGFIGHYHAARAENALWLGDAADALAIAEAAVPELASSLDLRWIGELVALGARAAADLGTGPGAVGREAASRAERLIAEYDACVAAARVAGTIFQHEAEGYRGTAAAELARMVGGSREAWDVAAATWQALGQPYPRAYGLYRAAEAGLLAGRSRHEAEATLREASALAEQLGAVPLRTAVGDLAQRARIELAAPDAPRGPDRRELPAPFAGLTPREVEVAALLGAGRSDREIADALFISAKTASVHVSNIKAKLGVDRRLEAAMLAAQLTSGAPPSDV